MLWKVITCAYAFDVRGEVVSESSGDFGSGVVEPKGEFKLLVWIGSHGCSLCRGTVVDRVMGSLVLC